MLHGSRIRKTSEINPPVVASTRLKLWVNAEKTWVGWPILRCWSLPGQPIQCPLRSICVARMQWLIPFSPPPCMHSISGYIAAIISHEDPDNYASTVPSWYVVSVKASRFYLCFVWVSKLDLDITWNRQPYKLSSVQWYLWFWDVIPRVRHSAGYM